MDTHVITAIVGRISDMGRAATLDPLELTSEERANCHFVAETASGRRLRVSLPRGFELQDGDVLADDGQTAVVITAKDEDLLFVKPGEDAVIWWAACYQLGNFHRPVRFRDDGILTPDDPMAAQMLRALGLTVERVHRPFVGRRFGAAGAHHRHEATVADEAPLNDHHTHHHA